jgi:AAA+ superfamily predicted ATPase
MNDAFRQFERDLLQLNGACGDELLEAMAGNGQPRPVKATAFAQLLNDFYYLLQWLWLDTQTFDHGQGVFITALDELIARVNGEDSADTSVQSHMRLWQDLLHSADYPDTLAYILEPCPTSLALLRRYDTEHRTEHADALADLMHRFGRWALQQNQPDWQQSEARYAQLLLMLDIGRQASPQPSPSTPALRGANRTVAAKGSTKTTTATSTATTTADPAELDQLLSELEGLIGLKNVKAEVLNLVNLLRLNQMRVARGLPHLEVTRHMVFYGNPGTGKTTVARLLAQILRALGVLKKGHLVETDRGGLVAAYVGQTALKVKRVFNQAEDGVLFIDEAYALVRGENDFGTEAVETLLKLMEDRRDNLVVIVAGYTGQMQSFIASNPGLKSRFTRYLAFEDYDAAELAGIFARMVAHSGMQLTSDALQAAQHGMQEAARQREQGFGNARFARNCFEKATMAQANRLAAAAQLSDEALMTLDATDIGWAFTESLRELG